MRRIQLVIAVTIVALVATMAAAGAAPPQNFRTHLSGAEEVPPVDTNAQGQLVLQVAKDGQSIDYRLTVANIEEVHMAHLHLAPAGVNGGIVVWLYPDAPPPQHIEGRSDGTLATGTFTADDLMGALEGKTIADLVDEIEAGNIYANVHTLNHGGGEIRGQVS